MPSQQTDAFTVQHSLENGIERVTYIPRERKFDTPIFMQHGMWHGAWCWQQWQELFAQWGWESHAISLPGHAGSPAKRPIYFCTLDYYLKFLQAEVDRLPTLPILMGHSMGGALTQWFLKYVRDDLPAAVLVAPWESHSAVRGYPLWVRLDFPGLVLATLTGSANPFIRSPQQAARKLISPGGVYTPEEFHARLSPESLWVMMQHNPPFWTPPKQVKTPLLWLAGEVDATITVEAQRRSAAYYQADFVLVEKAAHNLMMEHNHPQTARMIHDWLTRCGIK